MNRFDCVVVGGGMVGAASALSLADLGLSVAVIEQRKPEAFLPERPFDMRVSAISLASEQLLQQLGAWETILGWRVCPYKRLGVWEQESAYTEFNANDISQPHLGHIVENRLIQLALWQEMSNHKNVTLFCPETITSLIQNSNCVSLVLSTQTIEANIVIGADGANSRVRKLASIGITGWNYAQSAMLINVETKMPQQDITWQQFFQTGPVAMLPMPGQCASLVWYNTKDEIKRLVALSNTQLQVEIKQNFPERLGDISVNSKASFPLTRSHANQYIKERVVLIGDAAHTINPMAGQGVNLGFKDVKVLQQVIADAIGRGDDWHSKNVLNEYQRKRRTDNLLMMSAMDALYFSFGHVSPLAKFARNAGLSLVNRMPNVKRKALAYACGV